MRLAVMTGILWAACLLASASGSWAGEPLRLPPSEIGERINAHEPEVIPLVSALGRLTDESARYGKDSVDDRVAAWNESTVLHGIALGRAAGEPLALDALANASRFKAREVEVTRSVALSRANVVAALTLAYPSATGSATSVLSFERVFNSTSAYDQDVALDGATALGGIALLSRGVDFPADELISYRDVARGSSATRDLPDVDPRLRQATLLSAETTRAALPALHGVESVEVDELANLSLRNSDSGTRSHDITLSEAHVLAAIAAKQQGIPVEANQVWTLHDEGTVNRIDEAEFNLDASTVRHALALGARR